MIMFVNIFSLHTKNIYKNKIIQYIHLYLTYVIPYKKTHAVLVVSPTK